jgi:hypothetical protein
VFSLFAAHACIDFSRSL